MKKAAAFLTHCVAGLLLGVLVTSPIEAAVVPLQALLPSMALTLSSPDAIARFIWKNFSIESDRQNFGQEDHWQAPEELLKTKKGDCEDFARFAYELLRLNKQPAFMVSLYGNGYGHTICVFLENGRYQAIDGAQVKRLNAKTLQDVFGKIYPFWQKAALVKAAAGGSHGIILKEFQRS